jgi:hypothetical protein
MTRGQEIRWYASRVYRPDCGAPLYAPVHYVNNEPVEHGITPSCSRELMQKAADRLNAGLPI